MEWLIEDTVIGSERQNFFQVWDYAPQEVA